MLSLLDQYTAERAPGWLHCGACACETANWLCSHDTSLELYEVKQCSNRDAQQLRLAVGSVSSSSQLTCHSRQQTNATNSGI